MDNSDTIKNNEVAISVNHVAKTFRLPTESSNSIKQAFINRTKGIKGYREQKVLRDINFEVKKGDFFGIVGRNGSGKSTLLKIISGIYQPTAGSVQINGSLVSFIELGVGFNPELTGRENVYLNGAMLGFSRDEMNKMYDEIVDFAELGEFMDQKLKNYSSGMQVRLAFSCAIQAKSDILVLDEVLAVGDEAFQRKCSNFFAKIRKDENKTIVLVTHSMDAVRQYCNKAIFIEQGEILQSGDPEEVAEDYSRLFLDEGAQKDNNEKRYGNGEIKYINIEKKLTKDSLILDFDIKNYTDKQFNRIKIGIDFLAMGEVVSGFNTTYIDKYKRGVVIMPHEKKHFTMAFVNNFGKQDWEVNMNIRPDFQIEDFSDYLRPALSFQSNNIKYNPLYKMVVLPKIAEK